MKLKLFFILLLTFSIFHITSSITEGTVRYVSKTGSSTPPYTSWETAADSIQKAINICVDGDTVIVANGVYTETIIINRAITLIGSSMDSTIIDGTDLSLYKTVEFTAQGTVKNFWIKGQGTQYEGSTGVLSLFTNFNVRDCRISNAYYAIFTGYSSPLIKSSLMSNIQQAIVSPCFPDTCKVIVDSCIIITNDSGEAALSYAYGSPTITNNMIIEEGTTPQGTTWLGIYLDGFTRRALINNNILAGYYANNIIISGVSDSAFVLFNNTLYTLRQGSSSGSIITYSGDRTQIRNNIIGYSYRGLNSDSEPTNSDYNLYWGNEINTSGYAALNDSDVVANPMFVKDTIPTSNFNFDFHLQQYSHGIDKGDPTISDKDGTRSDIGLYGGPLGEKYTYQDLAPLAPRNLSALVDTTRILLRWKKNTEADTSHYNVYRDTVINFTIDLTKLVSSPADTFFIQLPPYKSSKFVYKITCVDNQGNESQPSEEIIIDLTTSINDNLMTISDYRLYQNYPNPFNPSTTIGYQLKERGYVKLMVYDITGSLVSVLVNKEHESGYYEVEFNAEIGDMKSATVGAVGNLASGIYLYRMEVIGDRRIPDYTDMKKMILIK